MTTTLLAPAPATSPAASRRPSVPAARRAVPLEASVARFLPAAEHNLGPLETQALHYVQALRRATPQRAAPAQADATPPRCPVCRRPPSIAKPNARARRRPGTKPERWHRVWTGTVFRRDHRGLPAGGRPVISERGYGLTRVDGSGRTPF